MIEAIEHESKYVKERNSDREEKRHEGKTGKRAKGQTDLGCLLRF